MPVAPSLFYAASIDSPTVTVFAGDFMGTSTAEFGISGGLYSNGQSTQLEVPFSVALGPNGNVYTLETAGAQATTASVAEYLPNFDCMGPVATLNGVPVGGSTPGAIAVDAAGYVYVASQAPRQLELYAPLGVGVKASLPIATIAIPTIEPPTSSLYLDDPIGIALDAAGRIYIANGVDKSILVYPARSGNTLSATTSATIAGAATTLQSVYDVAVDASGKIYSVDNDYPYGVKIFAAHPSGATNVAPAATISGAQTQIPYDPISVAVDHLGLIYVGDYNSPSTSMIFEFKANPSGSVDEAPLGMLGGVGNPAGLAAK